MKKKRTLTTYGVVDGKWTKWLRLDIKKYETWSWTCCDCGLVHDVQVRTIKDKIYFRMTRNNFLTKYWQKRIKKL